MSKKRWTNFIRDRDDMEISEEQSNYFAVAFIGVVGFFAVVALLLGVFGFL